MKSIRLLVCLLLVLQGAPLAIALPLKDLPSVFELPAAKVNEQYEVDIEAVLRDKYRLTLESESRPTILQWAMEGGDTPPGLTITTDGKIVGMLKSHREAPYLFRVRVQDMVPRNGDALVLELSVASARPRVRLTSIADAPRLVAVGERVSEAGDSARDDLPPARVAARAAEDAGTASAPRARTPRRARTAGAGAAPAPFEPLPPPTPCDDTTLPAMHKPRTPDGIRVYRLDARNGNLFDTSNGRLVTSQQRLKERDATVTIIIDHMNPYLYTYKYNRTQAGVPEQEIAPFLRLIGGGVVGEVLPTEEQPENLDAAGTGGDGGAESFTAEARARRVAACDSAKGVIAQLNSFSAKVERDRLALTDELKVMRANAIRLTRAYNSAAVSLLTPNRTRTQLYCDSTALLAATEGGVTEGNPQFIDPVRLEELKDDLNALKAEAARLEDEVNDFREDFPDCARQPDIARQTRRLTRYASQVKTKVGEYEEVRQKVATDLAALVAGRERVQRVLGNGHAFFEERAAGNVEETTVVSINFEVIPRQGVPEAVVVATSPFTPEFKFGEAPYFTVSGGLIFSALQKKEYVRVQGFERDRDGKEVLVDGKPNLTSIIGLKESSPTRITPAVFLHGRLPGTRAGFIDGVHLSLGVTAKNDKEGTDIEYLVGPSVSFFEHKMFLTVGGYAGKQQTLEGNLFEGAAVPESVSELPIRKDYRWNIGFALTYRIPGLSK